MRRIGSPRISSAPLSFRFEHVYPSPVKRLVEEFPVFFAKRQESFFYYLFRFFVRYGDIVAFHYRDVHIVHMELFNAERPSSHVHITVKRRQSVMRALYEVVIHVDSYVLACDARLHRSGIIPHLSVKAILFHVACVKHRYRIYHILKCVEHRLECVLSYRSVAILQKNAVFAVGHLYLFAVLYNALEGNIRVIEHPERVLEHPGKRSDLRKYSLLFIAEIVLLFLSDELKRVAEVGELFLATQRGYLLRAVARYYLGHYERNSRRHLDR